jgi:hypothetical protein
MTLDVLDHRHRRSPPSLAVLLVVSGSIGALVISAAALYIPAAFHRPGSGQIGILPEWFTLAFLVVACFFSGMISGGFGAIGWIIIRRVTTSITLQVVVVSLFGSGGGELCFFVSLGGTVGAWQGYALAGAIPAVAFGLVTAVWTMLARRPVKTAPANPA